MLERQLVEAAVARGRGAGQQRRVAFAQRDHGIEMLQKRNDLAIAPDAALIELQVGHAAHAPGAFQFRVELNAGVSRLQQAAALRAIVDDLGDGETGAAFFANAQQFSGHGPPIVAVRYTEQTMRAVHLQKGRVSVRSVPLPRRADGFARIRLLCGGICNTDLELQRGYYGFSGNARPRIRGRSGGGR